MKKLILVLVGVMLLSGCSMFKVNKLEQEKRALESELYGKGIDRKIIKTVLSETDVDDVGIARELIKKKGYKWDRLPPLEARKKKSEFLARKGFGWDVIKKVIDN